MFGPELTPDPMKVAAKTESVFEFPTTLSANYLSTPRRRRNSKSCSIISNNYYHQKLFIDCKINK